jgi:excisionase family DNA binding protein
VVARPFVNISMSRMAASSRFSPTDLSDLAISGATRRVRGKDETMDRNVVRGLYTVLEAAQLTGVGRSTMYELVRRGDVPSVRLGRKVLITRPTLEALLGCPPPTPAELATHRRNSASQPPN